MNLPAFSNNNVLQYLVLLVLFLHMIDAIIALTVLIFNELYYVAS